MSAKEEESSIVDTLKHLLNQSYNKIELIVINDRSKDQTGRKLEALKKWSDAKSDIKIPLKVIHITSLPSGWLGTSHALYQGYLQSNGEILLFTNTDTSFHPEAIEHAVNYMRRYQLDHFVLQPKRKMVAQGFLLQGLKQALVYLSTFLEKPWKANISESPKHGVGLSSFNMLRRDAYLQIGTHQALAMRPDESQQLGKRVKKAGLKQHLLDGSDVLSVDWYSDVDSLFVNLEKQIFLRLKCKLSLAFSMLFIQFFLFYFPFIGMWLFWDWRSIFYVLTLILMSYLYFRQNQPITKYTVLELMALPLTLSLCMYILVRSVYTTYKKGGLHVNGSFYSLKELKKMLK
ncbi:glycosyltransferase [Caldalkalibacillus mannanilyticus]|uniref:glycosyltransferase n=1 Tax=Caldalkalibacillus mannanilyticus TaxID=1418 RepID=UPI002277294E|nr:glycosyltransferase family 2 protein [Caldalkalibacillus mannanilyticus]